MYLVFIVLSLLHEDRKLTTPQVYEVSSLIQQWGRKHTYGYENLKEKNLKTIGNQAKWGQVRLPFFSGLRKRNLTIKYF